MYDFTDLSRYDTELGGDACDGTFYDAWYYASAFVATAPPNGGLCGSVTPGWLMDPFPWQGTLTNRLCYGTLQNDTCTSPTVDVTVYSCGVSPSNPLNYAYRLAGPVTGCGRVCLSDAYPIVSTPNALVSAQNVPMAPRSPPPYPLWPPAPQYPTAPNAPNPPPPPALASVVEDSLVIPQNAGASTWGAWAAVPANGSVVIPTDWTDVNATVFFYGVVETWAPNTASVVLGPCGTAANATVPSLILPVAFTCTHMDPGTYVPLVYVFGGASVASGAWTINFQYRLVPRPRAAVPSVLQPYSYWQRGAGACDLYALSATCTTNSTAWVLVNVPADGVLSAFVRLSQTWSAAPNVATIGFGGTAYPLPNTVSGDAVLAASIAPPAALDVAVVGNVRRGITNITFALSAPTNATAAVPDIAFLFLPF